MGDTVAFISVPEEFMSEVALAVLSIRAGMDDGKRRAAVFPGSEQRGGEFSVDYVAMDWLLCPRSSQNACVDIYSPV